MKWKDTAIAAACLLLLGGVALAHRVDEYLQATIISLQANQAQASMRLIPGVLVAPSVIDAIDSNHDGVFSESEKRAYAQRVLGDLSITMDGKTISPQLLSWSFPEPAQMREGLGEIRIEYRVELPPGAQHRALTLANYHLNPTSVYLMNAVVPEDPNIRILAQKRNKVQSVYELDYQQTNAVGALSGSSIGRLQHGSTIFSLQGFSVSGCVTSPKGPITFFFYWCCCFPLRCSPLARAGFDPQVFIEAFSAFSASSRHSPWATP
jgi:hypothetical protein